MLSKETNADASTSAGTEANPMLPSFYKPGEKAKIIACTSGHKFRIGEIVTIVEFEDDAWRCVNDKDKYWWVQEDEMEVIGKTIDELISPAWSWLANGKIINTGIENGDCFKACDVLHALKMVASNCG